MPWNFTQLCTGRRSLTHLEWFLIQLCAKSTKPDFLLWDIKHHYWVPFCINQKSSVPTFRFKSGSTFAFLHFAFHLRLCPYPKYCQITPLAGYSTVHRRRLVLISTEHQPWSIATSLYIRCTMLLNMDREQCSMALINYSMAGFINLGPLSAQQLHSGIPGLAARHLCMDYRQRGESRHRSDMIDSSISHVRTTSSITQI